MDAIEFWTICSSNGIVLDKEQVWLLERFHNEFQQWNEKVNMVSRTDVQNLYERHIMHSLTILKYAEIPKKARVLDVGTGGGFPGIPLKIARQDANFLLVDSIRKKVTMTEMFAKHTELKDITVKNMRVETLLDDKKMLKSFDVICARAVAPIAEIVGWTGGLLKPNGQYIFLKGGDLTAEIEEAKDQFPVLKITEHPISMIGAPWFKEQDKKVIVCTIQ